MYHPLCDRTDHFIRWPKLFVLKSCHLTSPRSVESCSALSSIFYKPLFDGTEQLGKNLVIWIQTNGQRPLFCLMIKGCQSIIFLWFWWNCLWIVIITWKTSLFCEMSAFVAHSARKIPWIRLNGWWLLKSSLTTRRPVLNMSCIQGRGVFQQNEILIILKTPIIRAVQDPLTIPHKEFEEE